MNVQKMCVLVVLPCVVKIITFATLLEHVCTDVRQRSNVDFLILANSL